MNHIIKGIIIVAVAITSMLAVGAISMIPIMQNSFASLGNTTTPPIILPTTPATGTGTLTIDLKCDCSTLYLSGVTVTGNNPQPSSFTLSDGKSQFVSLGTGSFAVSVEKGYGTEVIYSGDCKGTISAGQNLECHPHVFVPGGQQSGGPQ